MDKELWTRTATPPGQVKHIVDARKIQERARFIQTIYGERTTTQQVKRTIPKVLTIQEYAKKVKK